MSLNVICHASHDFSLVADVALNWKRYWPVSLMFGKNVAFSADGRTPVELRVVFFADTNLTRLTSHAGQLVRWIRRKIFLLEVAAAKHIERCVVGLDDVIADAAAESISQIKVLELVVMVVGETEDEDSVAEVQIAANAALESRARSFGSAA